METRIQVTFTPSNYFNLDTSLSFQTVTLEVEGNNMSMHYNTGGSAYLEIKS